MRPIDADALRADYFVTSTTTNTPLYRYVSMEQIANAPTVEPASPWHRVEELPKEEGRYWCAVWFDGHWIFDAAWYTHDISTVIDVPCCERVGGFYKGNTEVHPDYWMPIEPPKEDA